MLITIVLSRLIYRDPLIRTLGSVRYEMFRTFFMNIPCHTMKEHKQAQLGPTKQVRAERGHHLSGSSPVQVTFWEA